ncbi:MAG: hypothetical protein A2Y12_13570 [Planctomycetes bacterium GWF2_42_9]|nr:MAG: hypothetical protein A2Y12_13570 [Planctomycetes bacterium GWF2_42_9]
MRSLILTVWILSINLICGIASAAFDSGQCDIDSHTVALWHLNEGSGTTLYDASGYNRNASLTGTNSPKWSPPGLFGGDGLFLTYGYNNSPAKFGAIQLSSGLLNLQNFTLEMYVNWIYQSVGANPSDYYSAGYLVNDGTNMYVKTYMEYVAPYNRCKLTFGVQTSSGLLEVSTSDTNSISHETWTHLAFTRNYNGSATTIAIYVNGKLAAGGSKSGSPTMGGGFAQIGSSLYNTVSWGGSIDEIRLSDIARTSFCSGTSASCGDWGYLEADIAQDCYVSFSDLADFAANWLLCPGSAGDFDESGCVNNVDFNLFSKDWRMCTDPFDINSCTYAYDKLLNFENDLYVCRLAIGSGSGNMNGLWWDNLYNKQTGTPYLNKKARMPIFMIFGKGFMVDSGDFVAGAVTKTTSEGTQKWSIPLVCQSRSLSAELTVSVDSTEKMLWSLNVNNTSANTMELQPVFPLMGQINIGNQLEDNHYFVPWRSGIEGSIDCDLKYEYCNLAWMQIFSVFNPNSDAGLYTYPKDPNGGFKGMPFKKSYSFKTPTVKHSEIVIPRQRPYVFDNNSSTDLLSNVIQGIGFTYYYPRKNVTTGNSYSLPSTVIAVHKGGLKEALTDYKQWAHTWYTHVNTPKWFKNVFNTVGAWPGYFWSDSQNKYIRSENMQNPDPMHFEQWYGWWDLWNESNPFGGAGDFYYNQARGGLTAFKNEISAIQAKGTMVTVYIDNRFCWSGTDTGAAHGQDWAVMDPPGVYATYQKADDKWLECSYEPNAWVDYLSQTCGRIVRDTGMHSIYLDELPLMFPCYNPNHYHYQQDGLPFSVDRMRQFLVKARAAMVSEDANATLMTEHAGSDYFTQFYDGAWSQTAYKAGFPFTEKYYNENSINYFRFCFPEFKLAEWGPSDEWEERTFFNGIGICDYPLSGLSQQAGQVMKENGDAFASLEPEALIETKINKVLANKFPIDTKVIYTIYNKNSTDIENAAIFNVERKNGWHYVELYNDSNAINVSQIDSNDQLAFTIKAGQVLCVAQLPRIIQASRSSNTVSVALNQYAGNETLVAFFNYDRSTWGDGDGIVVSLTSGQGQFTVPAEYTTGKVILKLFRGDQLLDEMIMNEQSPSSPGTIVLWHLDETSGAVGYDSAGGNNNLVKGSTYSWLSGSSLFPISPYRGLKTPTSSCDTYCTSWINPDEITDKVTVSIWAKFTSVDPNGTYLIAMHSKFMIRIDGGRSSVQFLVYTPDDVWHQVDAEPLGSGVSIVNTGWHQITGVYDGTRDVNGNANLYLYWDGMLKSTKPFAISSSSQKLMTGGSSKVFIGAAPWNTKDTSINFVGSIDEITIKNIVEP